MSVPAHPAQILLLATADWSAPIATNQHHVARELAMASPVTFAVGNGTRRPTTSRADLDRVWRRLRASPPGVADRQVPAGVRVTPLTLVPHVPGASLLNPALVAAQTGGWGSATGTRVLWTFTPYTYGLERTADVVVYHLVDLIHENAGVDRASFLRAEKLLSSFADLAIGTSPAVEEHLRAAGFDPVLLRPNVSDTGVFLAATPIAPRRREVVFAGALNTQKLDLPLLEKLARRLPTDAQLTLVGPLAPGQDSARTVARLRDVGAAVLPAQTQTELASRFVAASVGLIPYQVNALTTGISPIKTYEYLACGLPVVSTALPAVHPVEDCVHVERTPEEFVARVLDLLAHDDTAVARRRALAARNDWHGRGQEYRDHLRRLAVTATEGPTRTRVVVPSGRAGRT